MAKSHGTVVPPTVDQIPQLGLELVGYGRQLFAGTLADQQDAALVALSIAAWGATFLPNGAAAGRNAADFPVTRADKAALNAACDEVEAVLKEAKEGRKAIDWKKLYNLAKLITAFLFG